MRDAAPGPSVTAANDATSGRARLHWRRALVAVAVLAGLVPLVGVSPSGAAAFCNTAPIVFTPPSAPNPNILPFDTYPSTITVSGATGTVNNLSITLKDFNYTRPEDVDVLLVAPDGTTNLIVMSDIGGDNVFPGEPTSHVDLTFSDSAAAQAPTDSQLSSGTYKPTNDNNDVDQFSDADTFLPPAPTPSAATTLSVFNGLPPNGTWKLYIVDDQPGPPTVGSFNGGWCIDTGATGPTTSSSSTSSSSSSTSTSTSTPTSTSTTTTTVAPGSPTISVGDVAVPEGDDKTRSASFPVTLSQASSQTVTVHYDTTNGSASKPDDFADRSGTVTFAPGSVKETITVPVRGDTVVEGDERFRVELSAPTNASIGDGVGVGTILDDDPGSGLRLAIGDVTLDEGNVKTQTATFTVSLSAPSASPVTVDFATADVTATAPGDYTARSGTITFSPGEVDKKVTVNVVSDTVVEPNEKFNVVLSGATGGATITRDTGVGLIRNDD